MDRSTSQLSTALTAVRLTSLTWGPIADTERPLAVLLHGFPDTAHTWRHLGPALAEAGYPSSRRSPAATRRPTSPPTAATTCRP